MDYGKIFHRAALNECYALNEQELEIAIQTGYEVEKVFLCYGDPFSAGIMGGSEKWSGMREEMTECVLLAERKRFSITVKPDYKRCKYYFELQSADEKVYFFEDGCYDEKRMQIPGRKEQCFFFPWMNPADINVTPDWVADTIWYQIFPDRFCNGDATINSKWAKPWKCEPVQHLDIYGGDLRGIRNRLPYLKELGITGIYLTPIFASKSNHKYNTADYYKIDPEFGDEAEFIALVEKAHEMGIRIMLDAVFNHCGTQFAPWQDVLANGKESKYFDWFFIHQFPFDKRKHDTRDGRFYSFAFHGEMPKLNTNNPEVVDYFKELCSFWLKEWKIDGIRFDVGNEVSHYFLKELRKTLKAVNPEVYLLGEIWHDSIGWLMGDEYDSVMNYPLEQSIHDFYIDKERTSRDFACGINRCYTLYMKQTNRVLFNLLDSHDTERLSMRTKTEGRFYQQLALLFTMTGSPCIYYGTEIRMPGGYDPDCRRCMPWEDIENGAYDSNIEKMKQLISMRKTYDACKKEKITWLFEEEDRVVHYIKKNDDGKILHVLLNAEEKPVELAKYQNSAIKAGMNGKECGKDNSKDILFSYGETEGMLEADGTYIWIE